MTEDVDGEDRSSPGPSEIQWLILNLMMDDAEDVEQIYLGVNGRFLKTDALHPQFLLHQVIDEMREMLDRGYIKAQYTNSENLAPIGKVNFTLFHYYWFSPTEKGLKAWKEWADQPENQPGMGEPT